MVEEKQPVVEEQATGQEEQAKGQEEQAKGQEEQAKGQEEHPCKAECVDGEDTDACHACHDKNDVKDDDKCTEAHHDAVTFPHHDVS